MPFDAITVCCLASELNSSLEGGRIDKITMPTKNDIILGLRAHSVNRKLLISCNPSLPRVHFTTAQRENPATPPGFCMLLRKHLTNGKILSVTTPGIERTLIFEVECKNELGDTVIKKIIVELFGKNSNIILLHETGLIADCIRHIDNSLSRERIILPGLPYFPPTPQDKLSPSDALPAAVKSLISKCDPTKKAADFILENFLGLSPLISREIVYLWGIDTDLSINSKHGLADSISFYMQKFANKEFSPVVIYDKTGKPVDFSCINIRQYGSELVCTPVEMLSEALDVFFAEKERKSLIKEKGGTLLKTVDNLLSRFWKKAALQEESILAAEGCEKYKLKGDLIISNIYKIQKGDRTLVTENFYSENAEEISIALDYVLSPSENAQKYYKRYNKLKNTAAKAAEQYEKTLNDIRYLESVQAALALCEQPSDIEEIRDELEAMGYIRAAYKKKNQKNGNKLSAPMKFVSNDGFTIYVGKNNRQNDFLTLKMSSSKDIWFHTKDYPGSHTVISCAAHIAAGGVVPDTTLTQAACLAAYYSKARGSAQTAVDYCPVKNVKKPSGAKPGMVIYEGCNTAYVTPDEKELEKLKA